MYLQDSFYKFLCPTLSCWFAFDEPFTCSDADVSKVFCEDTCEYAFMAASDYIYACFAGLPMGWSWALFFCQQAVVECTRNAFASLGWMPAFAADRSPPPPLTVGRAAAAIYVDNANIVGPDLPRSCYKL